MAHVKSRLTAVEVRQAKPAETGKARILADGGGLRLVIMPNESKYWQFRFTRGGKESSVQLGSYPDVDLATARDLANDERRRVKAGANPVLERKLDKLGKAAEAAITFKAVAEELLSIKKRNGISESYYDKIEGALKANLYPLRRGTACGGVSGAAKWRCGYLELGDLGYRGMFLQTTNSKVPGMPTQAELCACEFSRKVA